MGEDVTLRLGNLPPSEFSREFMQAMINRLAVGYHRYGSVRDTAGKIDRVKSMDQRLGKYLETGNTEFLIDVANFAMIEFLTPSVPHAGWDATGESPGVERL